MQIYTDRHALHRIPELELDLPETKEYLKNALSNLRCRVFSPLGSALMGKKVGDRVGVKVSDTYTYYVVIRNIEKGKDDASLEIRKY